MGSEVAAAIDEQEAAELLGPDGPLARELNSFEARGQQQEMVADITRAYNQGQIQIVEAGTGTGKSLAYLLPALLWAERFEQPTLISTNTINLQEQLLSKDIPLLKKVLGVELKVELVKGMGNYLCLRKLEDLSSDPGLSKEEESEVLRIGSWSETTKDGSRSDLRFVPGEGMWEKVAAEGDACSANRCPFFQKCHFFRARRKAAEADLLVANHHLLFSDLACRLETNNFDNPAVLPNYDRVVLDEAHNIEEVATEHFASRIHYHGILRLMGQLFSQVQDQKATGKLVALQYKIIEQFREDPEDHVQALLNRLSLDLPAERHSLQKQFGDLFTAVTACVEFFSSSRDGESKEKKLRVRQQHRDHELWQQEVVPRLQDLLEPARRFVQSLEGLDMDIEQLDSEELKRECESILFDIGSLANRLKEAVTTLQTLIMSSEDPSQVCWVEVTERRGFVNATLVMAHLDIAQMLADSLFKKFPTVILTSATLSTNRNFGFVRHRLGLTPNYMKVDSVREALYPSPFDYTQQALLALPNDLPLPNHPDFLKAAVEAMWTAIEASNGNTFLLFTSYSMLRQAHAMLLPRLEKAKMLALKHGDESRKRLLERFKETDRSVLFGTDSFWEGVDVSGEALRCVVLVKLPFQVPSEPLIQARTEAIESRGGSAFMEYSVPNAIVKFKQGFGRLIRHKKDRGCIVCLDSRLTKKAYGKLFLNSLPTTTLYHGNMTQVAEAMRSFYRGR